MMFCPKCGSLLKTKKEKTKTIQFCSCGYSSQTKEEAKLSEKVERKDEKIEVKASTDDVYPVGDAECPKCGHDKAYYWLKQTRAGDEAETKFFKCVKCKHTWRDYS